MSIGTKALGAYLALSVASHLLTVEVAAASATPPVRVAPAEWLVAVAVAVWLIARGGRIAHVALTVFDTVASLALVGAFATQPGLLLGALTGVVLLRTALLWSPAVRRLTWDRPPAAATSPQPAPAA